MASLGARHIIVSSRSGIADPASERIIRHCNNYGTTVVEAKGDIGDPQAVRRLFDTAKPRIAGIIQGAMVLRVSLAWCHISKLMLIIPVG
jgi:hypothetical protein